MRLFMFCLEFSIALCLQTREHHIGTHQEKTGIGTPLKSLYNVTSLTCGLECSVDPECSSATYDHDNKTCILLKSQDPASDWRQKTQDDQSEYLCINCQPVINGEFRISMWFKSCSNCPPS